jgi:regulation of enolase protein 1 (concanavalin A-like superfamily)
MAEWKNPLKGWLNRPNKKLTCRETKLVMRVPERTDCWRRTGRHGAIDSAPFHWQKVTGDFQATCKISSNMDEAYDKAGIMVRLDEENWILTGMEWQNNRANCSTTVTREHTDWSLCPLPEKSEKAGVWFCVKREGKTFETFYSFNGAKWNQLRQGTFSEDPVLYVGICGACPRGREFRATFEEYKCVAV